MSMFQDKKILLCVTGGIAAYKAIDLASMLVKSGCRVRTLFTDAAKKFVSPLNFAAITGEKVFTSQWDEDDPILHITLADWAEQIVVAPATANSIAKAVYGFGDNLLSATLLAHTRPVIWVPAMNLHMYENPITQENIARLKEKGHHVLCPDTGRLACGYSGKGKYPPNTEIMQAIACYLNYTEDLKGKKVLVTAGATSEAIDPMRVITNKSSGKMGIALARALALRGAEVHLVYANISVELPYLLAESVQATTVETMYEAVLCRAPQMDWIIKCAAVSDYKPLSSAKQKLKKGKALNLELIPTQDILAALGKEKEVGQRFIGFAAETEDLLANAAKKLKAKKLDLIVVNHLDNAAQDSNSIQILSAKDIAQPKSYSGLKSELAHYIINEILAYG